MTIAVTEKGEKMPRYIDADELLQNIEELIRVRLDWRSDSREERQGLNVAMCEIISAPTADVVEVVRCKDCDYSMGITEKKCPMWENIGDQNGYCKWWQSTTIFHK